VVVTGLRLMAFIVIKICTGELQGSTKWSKQNGTVKRSFVERVDGIGCARCQLIAAIILRRGASISTQVGVTRVRSVGRT